MMEQVKRSSTETDGREAGAALEALYVAEYGPMVRLAFTIVGDSAEAEDLVQDSFVAVSRRIAELHTPGGYLRTAVVSRCRSALRRRRTVERYRPEPPGNLSQPSAELWDVLGLLSDDQRVVVILRYWWGYPSSEIARVVEMPAATVRSHLRRGLKTLRRELES